MKYFVPFLLSLILLATLPSYAANNKCSSPSIEVIGQRMKAYFGSGTVQIVKLTPEQEEAITKFYNDVEPKTDESFVEIVVFKTSEKAVVVFFNEDGPCHDEAIPPEALEKILLGGDPA